VSQAVSVDAVEVETVVELRARRGDVVHRPDPDSEDPQPACPEATAHNEREYREVALAAVASHRQLCGNPECFGGDWR